MGRIVLLAALGLLFAGCAKTGNRIMTPADGATVPPSHGVVVFNLERAPTLDDTPIGLDLRETLSAERDDRTPLDPRHPRKVSAILETREFLLRAPETRFAFTLEPGDYTLTAIRVGGSNNSRLPSLGGAPHVDSSGALLATVLVLGTSIAVVRATEDPAVPPGPPPQPLPAQPAPASASPRFRIGPGEVLYIGDFLIGQEERSYLTDEPAWRTGASAFDSPETTRSRSTRLFVEYAIDEPLARHFVNAIDLGSRPLRTQPVGLSATVRAMFDSTPPPDPTIFRPAGPPRLARARPSPPAGVTAPPQPPPVPPAAVGSGPDPLVERFLVGEISKEQYDRVRAVRAAGP